MSGGALVKYAINVTPSLFSFFSNLFKFQEHSNSHNFYSTSPNAVILFALCSLSKNLTTPKRWDFSLLSRISGDFQIVFWQIFLWFKFFFRRRSLSWSKPRGVWSTSTLRQATPAFGWCYFNIYDFLLEYEFLFAFKIWYINVVDC